MMGMGATRKMTTTTHHHGGWMTMGDAMEKKTGSNKRSNDGPTRAGWGGWMVN